MRVEFKPCPDCGSEDYPILERDHITLLSSGLEVLSQVRASCKLCGWRTLWHKSVKGCAAEWNEAKVKE